jgi:hypothetical protein
LKGAPGSGFPNCATTTFLVVRANTICDYLQTLFREQQLRLILVKISLRGLTRRAVLDKLAAIQMLDDSRALILSRYT